MVYPAIVMFIAVAILVFLMIFIVPKFKEMFANSDSELPLISQIVFGFSEFCLASPISIIPNVVWLFVAGFIVYLGIGAMGKTKGGREMVDKLKLHMPVFGDIQRKSAVSRFARTLGTLVTSGVPILQALNITPSPKSTKPSKKVSPLSLHSPQAEYFLTCSFPWSMSAKKPDNYQRCFSK
jgi:type IV pilus assembly protein PilC